MLYTIANMGWRYPGKAGSHCKDGREDGAMKIISSLVDLNSLQ